MDAAGLAVSLVVVATKLGVKLRAFRLRMHDRPSIVEDLFERCSLFEEEAIFIKDELIHLQATTDISFQGNESLLDAMCHRLKRVTLLLNEFDEELGELNSTNPTTWLGKAMLQIRTDDVLPRIKDIKDRIEYYLASLLRIFYLLKSRDQSTDPLPLRRPSTLPLPTPPPSPKSHIPQPNRKLSNASSLSQMSDIERATRNLDIRLVHRLLDDDETLVNQTYSYERSLVDIAVCQTRSTHPSQLDLVEMLLQRGAKFTSKDKHHREMYREIKDAIKWRRSSR